MTDLQEKAMRMAYEVMTDIDQVCEGANHKRKDMHPYGGECPIQKRFDDAWEALRQALAQHVDAVNMSQECVDETAKCKHEPVAWQDPQYKTLIEPHKAHPDWIPLYTAPPKREWVGLTDDDVHDAFNYVEMVKLLDFDRDRPEWCEAFANACEIRLKHKNGVNK